MKDMVCILGQCETIQEVFKGLSKGFSIELDGIRNEFTLSTKTLKADIVIYQKDMGEEIEKFIGEQKNAIFGHFRTVECDINVKLNVLHQVRKSNYIVFINYEYQSDDDETMLLDSILDTMKKFKKNSSLLIADKGKTILNDEEKVLISDEYDSDVDEFFPYVEEIQFPSDLSIEKINRRNRTLELLRDKNIYVTEWLPLIEDINDSHIRSTEEIARRAIALLIISLYSESILGEGKTIKQAREFIKPIINKYDAFDYFSPAEKQYIENDNSTEKEQVDYSWKYENVYVMEWALGLVNNLPFPNEICDVPLTARTLLEFDSIDDIINNSKKREDNMLLDEADIIYRLDWACTDARISGLESPCNMDNGVVMERHKSLNWIIGVEEADWDDVDIST